jgi:hypothetical protein
MLRHGHIPKMLHSKHTNISKCGKALASRKLLFLEFWIKEYQTCTCDGGFMGKMKDQKAD